MTIQYRQIEQDDTERESCESCCADIGPSRWYAWHFADEDCRAVKHAIESAAEK